VSTEPDRHWLSDTARYLRQFAETENDNLLAAGPRSGEDEPKGKALPVTPDDTTQIDLLAREGAAESAHPSPWGGRPPQPELDPVGIPEAMTCPVPDDSTGRARLLADLEQQVAPCLKCPLGQTRNRLVFGAGAPDAGVMFVGEAPGRDEDEQGIPFVGRAGQLLTKILAAIDFEREEVYIGNILKCRPPGNRDPQAAEVEACEPYLQRQIELIRPAVICALGRISGQTLLRTTATLTRLREKVHRYQGRPLVVTYHPAALLRNPHWKRPAWEDVQLLRRIHDQEVGR